METHNIEAARQLAVCVRKLPGFIEVQDAALIGDEDDLRTAAHQFASRNFGIGANDLDPFELDDGVSIDAFDLETEIKRHPSKLLHSCLTDDELVELLLSMGFDLRDERGLPLRATKAIAPAVEAVARGLVGRPPDPDDAGLDAFSQRIQGEAQAFIRRRKR